jgi:phthalate 4,5-dioxygenase reductase subunit
MIEESDTVRSYVLVPADGALLPASGPGDHVKLRLPNGLVRQYSLCSNSTGEVYVIGVARAAESRGGSRWIHESLGVGDSIECSPRSNSFPVAEDASLHVMFAGGIGITPFLSMIEHFQRIDARFRLYYLARSRASAAFVKAIEASFAGQAVLYFSDDNQNRLFDVEAEIAALPEGAHVYCCGPAPLMQAVRDAKSPLPETNFHFEAFVSPADTSDESPFVVDLSVSKTRIAVAPGQTILNALRQYNVYVPTSCETGTCGTCVVAYSQGSVRHKDMCLTAQARQSYLAVCVSRASSESITIAL